MSEKAAKSERKARRGRGEPAKPRKPAAPKPPSLGELRGVLLESPWFKARANDQSKRERVALDEDAGLWASLLRVGALTMHEISVLDDYWHERQALLVADQSRNDIDGFIQRAEERPDVLLEMDAALAEMEQIGMDVGSFGTVARAQLAAVRRNSLRAAAFPLNGVDIELIREWNIQGPDGDLPLPKDDLASLDYVPLEIQGRIAQALAESGRSSIAPPKAPGMPSSLS